MTIISLDFLDAISDDAKISGGDRPFSNQVMLFPNRLLENPSFSNNFDSESNVDFDSGLSASASSSSSSIATPPEN